MEASGQTSDIAGPGLVKMYVKTSSFQFMIIFQFTMFMVYKITIFTEMPNKLF
jgi:hypothetical protein